VAGLLLGLTGLFPTEGIPFIQAPTATPLARVGLALSQTELTGSTKAWRALERDVEASRANLDETAATPFELLAALRGLLTQGKPDWEKAEALCHELAWQPCNRAALETLRESGGR
jgi:hypothetical protein